MIMYCSDKICFSTIQIVEAEEKKPLVNKCILQKHRQLITPKNKNHRNKQIYVTYFTRVDKGGKKSAVDIYSLQIQ